MIRGGGERWPNPRLRRVGTASAAVGSLLCAGWQIFHHPVIVHLFNIIVAHVVIILVETVPGPRHPFILFFIHPRSSVFAQARIRGRGDRLNNRRSSAVAVVHP